MSYCIVKRLSQQRHMGNKWFLCVLFTVQCSLLLHENADMLHFISVHNERIAWQCTAAQHISLLYIAMNKVYVCTLQIKFVQIKTMEQCDALNHEPHCPYRSQERTAAGVVQHHATQFLRAQVVRPVTTCDWTVKGEAAQWGAHLSLSLCFLLLLANVLSEHEQIGFIYCFFLSHSLWALLYKNHKRLVPGQIPVLTLRLWCGGGVNPRNVWSQLSWLTILAVA